MSKEHPGGVGKPALIPIHSWAADGFEVVPQFVWDPAATDKLSELIEDHVQTGGDVRELLLQILNPEIRELTATALRKMLSFIRCERKPRLAADQIAWVCGLALVEGETIGTLAKRHGISKQAFQQGAERFRALLRIRSQTRRSDEAREKMSKRNHRRSHDCHARH